VSLSPGKGLTVPATGTDIGRLKSKDKQVQLIGFGPRMGMKLPVRIGGRASM
jgi:hypothetical protein